MRLINTTTLQLHEFHSAPEPYAILSHTWEDEEVDLRGMSLPDVTSKKGYKKIADTCRVAKDEGYRYAWVDTCCIDKSSSADLSEAINSMYRWYKDAAVCYAYLSDVPRCSFADSRWFTRGWTLQELIAPRNLKFFDSEWTHIGSKCDPGLLKEISIITGIASDVLEGSALPSEFAIATRMSWAASRETTRVEDKAYCLLGIFGVHMPMIYGEGEMAFRRLQEEIIRRENDLTIFAWNHTPGTDITTGHEAVLDDIRNGLVNSTVVPLFAPSPAHFERGATPFSGDFWEFSLSNKGLVSKIMMRVFIDQATKLKVYGIMLGFSQVNKKPSQMILRKIGPSLYSRWDKYPRTSLSDIPGQGLVQSSILRSSVPYHLLVDPIASKRVPFAQFRTNAMHIPIQKGIRLQTATPSQLWDETDRLFLRPDAFSTYDVCLFARMEADTGDGNIRFLVLVYFADLGPFGASRPVCKISLESETVTDLLKRINAETSPPFEELCTMMPDVSRWRSSVYIGMYQGVKKTTYEISVSVEKAQIQCECAVGPIAVNDLVVRVEKK